MLYFGCKDTVSALYAEFSIFISDESSQSRTSEIIGLKEVSAIHQYENWSPGLGAQVSNDLLSAQSAVTMFWQDQVRHGRLRAVEPRGESVGFLRAQLKVRAFSEPWRSPAEEEGPRLREAFCRDFSTQG